MRATIVIAGVLFVGLVGCTSAGPPRNEIPSAIVNAQNAADHKKIADYFVSKALAYDAEAAQHELFARSYINRTRGDSGAMTSHCRALREQFLQAAKAARALAQEHSQLAESGQSR